MSAPAVTPKLPSGQQMVDEHLPVAVQEQVRAIATQVLQRLLAPIVRRLHFRRVRAALKHRLLGTHTSWEEVEAAALAALQHTSYLGAVTRDLYTVAETHSSAVAAAAATAVPAVDAATGAEIRERVRAMLNSGYAQVCVYLQEERLEWEWEPASEVLVLLGGSLQRRGTAVALAKAAALSGGAGGGGSGSPGGSRRGSAAAGGIGFSRRGSTALGGPARPGTAPQRAPTSGASSPLSATTSTSRRPSLGLAQERLGSGSGSGMAGATGAPLMLNSAVLLGPPPAPSTGDVDSEWLTAPQVLGELACLGSFPYGAALTVSSPTAVVMRISKAAYCHVLSECVAPAGQQRLLVEAMQQRERLLPYFAPLTRSRMQLCPLLSRLRPEQLEHLRDLVRPRVCVAGMECGERLNPTHIFFIRRGVVQMHREATMAGNDDSGNAAAASSRHASDPPSPHPAAETTSRLSFSLTLPKNRSILVDGHTFGETSCIFGDAVGDRYTAVTHVDMYLLPFQVLIQLIKQEPEVQHLVYNSAQELSYMRDREWAHALFGPQLVGAELPGVHGVVPAEGVLAQLAAQDGHRGSKVFGDAGVPLETLHGRAGGALRGAGHGGSPAPTRRVTIFEEGPAAAAGGGAAAADRNGAPGSSPLTGGRVSSAMLTAMEQLPLVSLMPSVAVDFYRACILHWQCVPYMKGDVIATAGEECNRVLFFFEGRAGVVINASLLRDEMQPGPFGRADIAMASAAAVSPIPAGHAVGYTCVRRHRWTRTIIALDDLVEVWELRRNTFVQLLRMHNMEQEMQAATLQLLQPLAAQKERLAVLDYQPLLHPMPSSLWTEQAVPNVHPVVTTSQATPCFPVWRDGDFPLDRRQSLADATARATSANSRRATLSSVNSVKLAAVANERQRSVSRAEDSPLLRSRRAGSVTGMSETDSGNRSNFLAQLTQSS